jgi:hypothetical protein
VQAFQAQRTSEFGDEVQFGDTERELASIEVVMSSWACESGSMTTCTTTPGATFTHPITMNIYAVDESGATAAPGALLASRTENSVIPFRPSADNTNCTGGRWFNTATGTCHNGLAFRLEFDFPAGTTLPERVIWTVAYNTTHAGANPIGTGAACYSTPTGCPYDSLNVGAQTFPGAPYQGIDVDPDAVFLNSTDPAAYCDGGAGGTSVLRFDSPCWTDYKPLGKITAV